MTFDRKHDGRGDRKSACSLEILLRSTSREDFAEGLGFCFSFLRWSTFAVKNF